ncbi:MAG: hypothetical protein ABJG15_17085 [Hyphomonadaceae bacterium]
MRTFLPLILAPLLLAGCASDFLVPETPQGSATAAPAEPDDGRYTVIYRGTPGSTASKTRDLALLRASSITLQKGGDWFEIVTEYAGQDKETTSDFERDPFGNQVQLKGECGLLGCPSNSRPQPGFSDAERGRETRISPTHSFEIIIHENPIPFTATDGYDAVRTSEEVRERYYADDDN